MGRAAAIGLLAMFCLVDPSLAAGRLKMDDKASLWPRAGAGEKIDFANRVGKAMSTLSPGLDSGYFMRCLEEVANIGDTKALTLSDMVRTCISLQGSRSGGSE
ncbi:MAG TPA: hypothetical protein VGU70_07235 [Methylobacterium sp.]|jgi:hypothetical protein|uniref:hypothetical protein n=1 Tax=Methylorubrum sp. B1-46 TaxID=2897334 RepID=UPI001E51DD9A|nr:hypothetical protein [Methylorubrum sp. B1-46]UGB23925.1 hypothetical protein LPC10_13110 [Methylorubrum sp. B1-46]HEV2542540.1 hypothetical protein [Methylobacterium sp.]